MKKLAVYFSSFAVIALWSASAFAQDGYAANQFSMNAWVAIAAALAIGITGFGGALGQGKAAAAALEGIARNPQASGKLFTPLILGLALIESLVIYGFIIAFMLLGKIA